MTAFGLALLMGASSLGGIPVFAAEGDGERSAVTDTFSQESIPAAKEAGTKVLAEDIEKEVSDPEFFVETCMEGIRYDAGAEAVTLTEIKGEDSGAYDPKKAGVYVASYLVVPKDQRDSYVITRKITLTDTEGQAHTEQGENKMQKKDTASEEDSEGDTNEEPEVRVTSSDQADTRESLAELEEEIASGEALVLSGAANDFRARTTVNLQKGEKIYYPSYIGNYSTCWFTVNGKIAYCLQSQKASPPSGAYVAEVLDSNTNLQKVLYYGYGGAGDITESCLSGKSAEEKYIYTHIAASYAYAGEAGFTGCDPNDLVRAGVIAYIDHLFGMEGPPKGEITLSKTHVSAVREGDIQKTPDIKMEGDHRNYITVSVPKEVTCVNKTKGTYASDGDLRIYGGDAFYLKAPLSVVGSYTSGKLHGLVGETWRTLVLSTGTASQDIGVFESEHAQPVSFGVDWLEMTRIELLKKDADTRKPLAGAVYGIYSDQNCENLLLTMPATGTEGKAVSDYFDAALKTVYVREITAPPAYVQSSTVHKAAVKTGTAIEVHATDERITGSIHIRKVDGETGDFLSQGDSALTGAVYGLYAKEDIVHPDKKTGVLYQKDSLITQGAIKTDGTMEFSNLYLGEMYLKEITPPEGYTLDGTRYDVSLYSEGQGEAVVTRDLTVKETVKKQAFQLIKISEDGEQTEAGLVKGAGFKVYLVSSLSQVKSGALQPGNGSAYTAADFIGYDFGSEPVAVTYAEGQAIPVPELITDAKGYAISPELPYGLYVVDESTVPENLKKVDPFLVSVHEDSREPMQWRIFDDRPFEFFLKIIKKDAQTGNTVLKAGAAYKIYDCEKEAYVEQVIQYPKKEKLSVFKTNEEGYLVTPKALKASTYRIEETAAPDAFVRQGHEMSLYAEEMLPALVLSSHGEYKENPKAAITITVSSDTAHQIDPDTGAVIAAVEQPNDEQVGSLTLTKTGEQLEAVEGDSFADKAKKVFANLVHTMTGKNTDTGIFRNFIYEESGVEGAVFELHAKETIYSPDGAKDEAGNRIVRYRKDALVAALTTDKAGKAVLHNLPLGSYYLKETAAGEHFVLNTEQKAFTLTAEDDTQAVVYEGVSYKNERQKISVSIEKQDAVSKEALGGVVFGLYTAEDILSQQGEILVEQDTLLEKKATDENGKLTFDSDLYHGKYYVKEELQRPGYLPNEEEIWVFAVAYEDQNVDTVTLSKVIENQPTESHFTKVDATTKEELSGAKLQITDPDGNVIEEWISTKEPHIVYALPAGNYTLHEELAPYKEGYVSAAEVAFEIKEDGSITEVEMEDEYSRTEISKTDSTTGEELKGAKLQILDAEGTVRDEWITNGEPHRIEKLPVHEELILREIAAPEGYALAEDVTFTLEDTLEIQKVKMPDSRIPEIPKTPAAPKTGDDPWKPMILTVLCGAALVSLAMVTIQKRKRKEERDE